MLDFLKANNFSFDEVLVEAKMLHDGCPEPDTEARRNIAERIKERIIIDDTKIDITLLGLPPSEEMTNIQSQLSGAG
jgi:hypothetical protein